MPQDSGAPAPAPQEPVEVTPEPVQTDTAQNTPPAADPFQSRLWSLQAEVSRRYPEMPLPGTGDNEADYKTLLATFTKENQKPKPVAKPDDGTVSYKERWEQDQARLVKATLGPEVEPARTAFDRAYEMDQTPFGFALALESYAQARMAGATPAEAASSQAPTRAQAVTPRVDSNQSDVNPDQVQTQIDQARQQGDLAKALRLQREHPEMRLRV